MATISIAKKHHLTHKKAKDVAREDRRRTSHKRFDLDYAWDGDDDRVRAAGVTGQHARRQGARSRSTCKLGFLLSMLKPTIEREIHAQLDKLVGRPKRRRRAPPRKPRRGGG